MDRGDDTGFGRIIMWLAVILGATSAGTIIGHGSSNAPVATSPPAAAPAAPLVLPPSALLRPLALVADAIGPSSLYRPGANGALELTDDYREALGSEPPPCPTPEAAAGSEAARNQAQVGGTLRARPGDCALIAFVRKAAAARNVTMRIVIATLPDWADSTLQWTFDAELDALQMAAADLGYVTHAYDLPDTDSVTPAPASNSLRWKPKKLHEIAPGALLLRRAKPATDPRHPPQIELLLVLLVAETATAGIHPIALANALDLALLWTAPHAPASERASAGLRPDAVMIMGPSYSGSRLSLNAGLEFAMERHGLARSGPAWFNVISPSASSPGNPTYLNIPGVSRFSATIRSDDDELRALANFLGRADPGWRCGQRMALLIEANTTWGQYLLDPSDAAKDCAACLNGDKAAEGARPLACAAAIPFPMHISRLRSEAQHAVTPPPVKLPNGAAVGLDLGEPVQPIDRVPPVTPELTAASVEIMIGGMFRAIDDRGITSIGILSTDKRDHVFLAQEIALRRPNVLSFTIESSLMYLHPDVASFVRGTVVASTYSLNERTQLLTRPALAGRFTHQFAAVAGHGVYNSLAALLGDPTRMLDYDTPAGPGEAVASESSVGPCRPTGDELGCTPPVWISVAAHDSLIPVAFEPGTGCAPDSKAPSYALCVARADAKTAATESTQRPRSYLEWRRFVLVLGALLVALAIGHQILRVGMLPAQDAFMRSERDASLAALRGPTALLGLWLLKLVLIHAADRWAISPTDLAPFYRIVCVCVVAYFVRFTHRSFWRSEAGMPRQAVVWLSLYGFVTAAAILVLLPPTADNSGEWLLLYVIAALSAAAGLADLRWGGWRTIADQVPVWRRFPAALGLGAFLCLIGDFARNFWAPVDALLYAERAAMVTSLASSTPFIALLCGATYWWGCWNLRRLSLLRLPAMEVGIGPLLSERAGRTGLDADGLFRKPTLTIGPFMLVPAVGTAIALGWGRANVGSIEGNLFGGFLLLGASCMIAVMGHTLAHAAHLGGGLKQLLRSLGRHAAIERFKELSAEIFPWKISYRRVHLATLEPLNRQIVHVQDEVSGWTEADLRLLKMSEAERLALAEKAAQCVEQLGESATFPGTDPIEERHWRALDSVATAFDTTLQRAHWRTEFDGGAASAELKATLQRMEYVVLFQGAIVLRELVTRWVTGCTAVIGGLVLMLAAHLFYTFQGRVFWLTIDAIAIGIAGLVNIRLLLTFEHDPVLSRLWSAPGGATSPFGTLTWRMAAYLLITLATLFSVFFPEVTGRMAGWLAPARQLLP